MYRVIRRQRRWSSLHCGRASRALLQHAFVVALMQHAFVLARIRLTRTAAERGPVLSGECGQVGVVASRLRTGPHSPYEDDR